MRQNLGRDASCTEASCTLEVTVHLQRRQNSLQIVDLKKTKEVQSLVRAVFCCGANLLLLTTMATRLQISLGEENDKLKYPALLNLTEWSGNFFFKLTAKLWLLILKRNDKINLTLINQ